MSDHVQMHAIIKGDVQGVGFRAMAKNYALTLKLKGTVRNLPNDTVEIYAQGERWQLDELIHRLKTDGFPGNIESVKADYSHTFTPYDDFRIIR